MHPFFQLRFPSITRAGLLPRFDKEERGVALAHPKHGDALELRGNVFLGF